jgi:protein MpaA
VDSKARLHVLSPRAAALPLVLAALLTILAAPRTSAAPVSPIVKLYGYAAGYPLLAYTYGSGGNVTMILASIHGNERNTRPLAEKLSGFLTTYPDSYAGQTVVVVPCVNPWGWAHDSRINEDSVDLNRNFPVGWHANVPGKLSRGTRPLSEPESAALAHLIQRVRPDKIVSIHNPLHLIDPSGAGGNALAKVIAAQDGYPIPAEGVGYPTPGSLGDFCEQYGIAIVTLELQRDSAADAWAQNKTALLAAIKWPYSSPKPSGWTPWNGH